MLNRANQGRILALLLFAFSFLNPPSEVVGQDGAQDRVVIGYDKFDDRTRSAEGPGATRLGRVNIYFGRRMEVHIRANTSATSLSGRADFTTGFSVHRLPQNLKQLDWSEAARFVTVPEAKTWVNCGSLFVTEMGPGDHSIYWFAGNVKGHPVTFDAGVMSVQAFPLSHRSPGRSAKKLALLVGINKYRASSVNDLAGCRDDVNDLEQLLINRFDFDEGQILKLVDEEATRDNIITAFEDHLIAKADRNTIAVFHYSGHGSQTTDLNGDESDRLDETIVPHDGRTVSGSGRIRDITDDTIQRLFRDLSKKTDHVTFVFDSCHSGTVTKARGAVSRWTSPQDEDEVNEILAMRQRGLIPESDPEARATSINDRSENYVLISGCRPEELSYEMRLGSRRRGALTYYFTSVIRESEREGLTYDDVMKDVRARVNARFRQQHPQIEGANRGDLVFYVPSTRVAKHYIVSRRRDDITLAHGTLDGLSTGSMLNVFPVGTTVFDVTTKIASVELVTTNPAASRARIIRGRSLPEISWGILESRGVEPQRIALHLDEDGDSSDFAVSAPSELRRIAETIQADPEYRDYFQFVDRPEQAALLVFKRKGENIIEITDGSASLYEVGASETSLVEGIPKALESWGKWIRIVQLENPRSNLDVELDVLSPETPHPLANDSEVPVFLDGAEYDLKVTNRSDVELHVTIVTCSSDGSINVLYPPKGDGPDDVMTLKPREKRIIGPVGASIPETTSLDRVRDHLKLFATTEPIDLRGIEQSGTRTTRAGFFENLIFPNGSKERTTVPSYDWAAAMAVYEVVRKDAE